MFAIALLSLLGMGRIVGLVDDDENDAQVLINNEVVLTLRDVDFQTLTFADIQLFSIPTLANRV